MEARLSPAARDAALRRSARLRWSVATGAIVLAGGLAALAARSQPGTAHTPAPRAVAPAPAAVPDHALAPPPAPPAQVPAQRAPDTSSGGS